MTFSCAETRDRFEDYAAEALTREERAALREHLASCDQCRSEAAAADPLFLFAPTGAESASVAASDVARVLEGVRAGVALKQAERRIAPPASRRRWSAAGAAAAALLLTLLAPGAPARREAPAAAPRQAAETGFSPAAAPAEALPAPPGGAQKFPADATIYDFNPGAGQPRVVWIVDRSIDI
ncbi:MAG TPA: zf-HC2 domain-containing protein [Thermoanaerobaculia bacterium]|nr:zf-HC2 domain-containing protein [Thermoanaerobaculia bacterium]